MTKTNRLTRVAGIALAAFSLTALAQAKAPDIKGTKTPR